ncbi:MAG: hypothetical protein V4582_18875 [Pseudomonadota bacterium]
MKHTQHYLAQASARRAHSTPDPDDVPARPPLPTPEPEDMPDPSHAPVQEPRPPLPPLRTA